MAASVIMRNNVVRITQSFRYLSSSNVLCRRRKDTPEPDNEILKSIGQRVQTKTYEKEKFPGEFNFELPKGKIFDKKPFKMELEEGKKYLWCTCGRSKNGSLCDGSHKQLDGTSFIKTQPKFRPMAFVPKETKEYWLCNCKQTSKPPFCDGTHRRGDIQDAIRS